MKNKKKYITHAPKQKEVSIATEGSFTMGSNYPGDSVVEHERLEESNEYLAEKELGQQRENS